MGERLLAGLVVVPFLLGAAAAPADEAQVVFSFQDNDIVESSGLVVARGLVVTTNDSGDTGRVFTVDPATGKTVGTTGWGDDPQDVEALAPLDDNQVWVGDIGDNTRVPRLHPGHRGPGRERQRRHRRPDLRPRLPRRAARRRDPDERPHHRPPVRRDQGGPRRHALRRADQPRSGRSQPARAARRRAADRHRRRVPPRRQALRGPQLRGGRGLRVPVAGEGRPVPAARPAAGRGARGGRRRQPAAQLRGAALRGAEGGAADELRLAHPRAPRRPPTPSRARTPSCPRPPRPSVPPGRGSSAG